MNELKNIKTGFIGAGNMGTAIITGLSASVTPSSIYLFDIDKDRVENLAGTLGLSIASSIEETIKACDIVIIAVKPHTVPIVLKEIKASRDSAVIVSVAAGVPIAAIEEILGASTPILRIMPNTPALVREGMSVISANSKVDNTTIQLTVKIFEQVGKVLVLPEKYMDAVTGISGSGPAYVFTFIQAMADGAVKMGIPRQEARLLASQTVLGAAQMVIQQNENPIALRDAVTSPGGTTIEAVHILEDEGFSGTVMSAIEAATIKSKKLGSKK